MTQQIKLFMINTTVGFLVSCRFKVESNRQNQSMVKYFSILDQIKMNSKLNYLRISGEPLEFTWIFIRYLESKIIISNVPFPKENSADDSFVLVEGQTLV